MFTRLQKAMKITNVSKVELPRKNILSSNKNLHLKNYLVYQKFDIK